MGDDLEQDRASGRIHALLVELADALTPDEMSAPLLNEWVLVASWTDAESGRVHVNGTSSVQTFTYQALGLLRAATLMIEDDFLAGEDAE